MNTENETLQSLIVSAIERNKIAVYSALIGFLPVFLVAFIVSSGISGFLESLFWAVLVPLSVGLGIQHQFKASIRKKKQMTAEALTTNIHVHANDVYVADLTPEAHVEILESVMNDTKNYVRQFTEIGKAFLYFVRQYIIVFPMTLLTIAIFCVATADPQVILNTSTKDIVAIQSFIIGVAFLVVLLMVMVYSAFPYKLGFVNKFKEDYALRIRQKLNISATGKIEVIEIYKMNENNITVATPFI